MKSQGEDHWDVTLGKMFDLTEKAKLKLTGDIFDIFNHAQFAQPNVNLASPGFGQVGHQLNLPRTIQLAARITF